jgi:transcriptional regulator with XRE-family HTH domain
VIGPAYCRAVDDLRVGRVIRAVRHRRGWRQSDVAARASVPQSAVSEIECGQLDGLRLRTIRSVCAALEIRIGLEPSWRGSQLARLLDSRHALLVETVVAALAAAGWEASVEYTFAVFGERGSVDILAWRTAHRALLLVEIKTELVDLQNLLSVLDRKARLVPGLAARDLGWEATRIGVVVVLAEGGSAREAVARHRATFAASLPQRGVEIRRWIGNPATSRLRGIWFLRPIARGDAMQGRGGPRRVRAAGGRSGAGDSAPGAADSARGAGPVPPGAVRRPPEPRDRDSPAAPIGAPIGRGRCRPVRR